jgi:hypothetical protein
VRQVSFYHEESGLLSGLQVLASDDKLIELNTPPDHIAIDGHHDHLSRRFDLEKGELVDWQPPQPSTEHEWNDNAKRWHLSAAAQKRNADRAATRARIAELERDVQPGLLRAVALDQDGAKERLAALDAEIACLRELTLDPANANGPPPP